MLRVVDYTFQIPKYLLKIINNYVIYRNLLYETTEGEQNEAVTDRVTQESFWGPIYVFCAMKTC